MVPLPPGSKLTFSANIEGEIDKSKIGYQWSVDRGKIISGHGTSTIIVSTQGLDDPVVMASITITGLPVECPSKASHSSFTWNPPRPKLFSEIGIAGYEYIHAIVDTFWQNFPEDPTALAYIISYGSERQLRRRERLIKSFLKNPRVDIEKYIFINKKINEETIQTKLWIVPAGADMSEILKDEKVDKPICPTVTVSGPPTVPNDGKAKFLAVIRGDIEEEKLSYFWTIDRGEFRIGSRTEKSVIIKNG